MINHWGKKFMESTCNNIRQPKCRITSRGQHVSHDEPACHLLLVTVSGSIPELFNSHNLY